MAYIRDSQGEFDSWTATERVLVQASSIYDPGCTADWRGNLLPDSISACTSDEGFAPEETLTCSEKDVPQVMKEDSSSMISMSVKIPVGY